MKIYTKTGDGGETSLFSGGRVHKHDARIEAYGTIDELSATVGVLRTEQLPAPVPERLAAIQNTLFEIGSALADPDGKLDHDGSAWDPDPVEAWIDDMESELEPLRAFILPGGTRPAALAHVARTVCRRAERRVSLLVDDRTGLPDGLLPYLNRISDALFVLARFLNRRAGAAEVQWRPRSS